MTIRERIDERGIAEPSVVEKNDEIIVELPGLDEDATNRVRQLIARTAKLEFKLVIDEVRGRNDPAHPNEPYMRELADHVKDDPVAKEEKISDSIDLWTPEDKTERHEMRYLFASDQQRHITVAKAKDIGCFDKKKPVDTVKDPDTGKDAPAIWC